MANRFNNTDGFKPKDPARFQRVNRNADIQSDTMDIVSRASVARQREVDRLTAEDLGAIQQLSQRALRRLRDDNLGMEAAA